MLDRATRSGRRARPVHPRAWTSGSGGVRSRHSRWRLELGTEARHGALVAAPLIAGALAFCLVFVQVPVSRAAHHSPRYTQEQPNIVVIQTDDQAVSQFNRTVMPNVTKLLASEGTRFDHAYLTTPECCPSRASLLTGQYGHNNGVLSNSYALLNDKRNVLPMWLTRAGYVTAHVGKFLNAYHL